MTERATRERASAENQTSAARHGSAAWTRTRRGAFAVYALVLAGIVAFTGVPTGRIAITVIVISGLCITLLGSGWRNLALVLVDWLPFTAILIGYDRIRAIADAIGVPVHETDVLAWERGLFGGHVPTVWLQQRWYDPHRVTWYDAAFTLVYVSHFLATPVLAGLLWLRDRTLWLLFSCRVVLLSMAGLATYLVFPEAPPWLAARDGAIGAPVARLSARGWIWLHAGDVETTLARAQQNGSNPVAAMPSLHMAFACLVALFLASRLRSRWRALLALYPAAMGVALVYQGEHYVLDLIAGVGYALAVHAGLARFERRRTGRRLGPDGATDDGLDSARPNLVD